MWLRISWGQVKHGVISTPSQAHRKGGGGGEEPHWDSLVFYHTWGKGVGIMATRGMAKKVSKSPCMSHSAGAMLWACVRVCSTFTSLGPLRSNGSCQGDQHDWQWWVEIPLQECCCFNASIIRAAYILNSRELSELDLRGQISVNNIKTCNPNLFMVLCVSGKTATIGTSTLATRNADNHCDKWMNGYIMCMCAFYFLKRLFFSNSYHQMVFTFFLWSIIKINYICLNIEFKIDQYD